MFATFNPRKRNLLQTIYNTFDCAALLIVSITSAIELSYSRQQPFTFVDYERVEINFA